MRLHAVYSIFNIYFTLDHSPSGIVFLEKCYIIVWVSGLKLIPVVMQIVLNVYTLLFRVLSTSTNSSFKFVWNGIIPFSSTSWSKYNVLFILLFAIWITVDHNFSRTQHFREFREAVSNRENIVLAKDRNSSYIFGNQCQHLHPGIWIYIFIATCHSASGTC